MRLIFPLLLALPLWAAPAPFLPRKPGPAEEADWRALQGEWVCHGHNAPRAWTLHFDGEPCHLHLGDGKVVARFRVTLAPPKSPKVMTFVTAEGTIIPCRYSLRGDTLTVSPAMPGGSMIVAFYKRKKP